MNAIEPYRPSGGGKLVQFTNGDVAADVRLRRIDRRNRLAFYEIRLVTARSGLEARLVGVDARGDAVELGVLDVGSSSVGSSSFSVPLPSKGRGFTGVFLELRADDLLLNVAAPSLPQRKTHPALRVTAALLALGITAVAGSGFAFAIPDAPTLAAPSHAVAGDVVHLGYALRGLGSPRYVATLDDGSTIAGAELHAPHGEIAFMLPATSARHKVSVALSMSGMLGTQTRRASIAVAPPPPPTRLAPVARVAAFSARREAYGNGESILTSYLAVADDGELSITDHTGRVVARAPFRHRGSERMIIPDGFQGRALSVRLDVRSGASRATATVDTQPVLDPQSVLDGPAEIAAPSVTQGAAPQADDVPEAIVPAEDQSSTSGDEPFVISGTPLAGQPMTVAIKRFVAGMHLRLQDDAGLVIDEADVNASTRNVRLRTPVAMEARTYYLSCSYGSGSGQETLVRSVRVSAR